MEADKEEDALINMHNFSLLDSITLSIDFCIPRIVLICLKMINFIYFKDSMTEKEGRIGGSTSFYWFTLQMSAVLMVRPGCSQEQSQELRFQHG